MPSTQESAINGLTSEDTDLISQTAVALSEPSKCERTDCSRNRDLLRRLVEEMKRLQTQLERDETCAVCSALLLADKSEPPHCIDCYVTDEVREQWEGNP